MSVSPLLDIYSVSTTVINLNKLSIPIRIEDTEERSIETLRLIDSGAGGKFINQNYAKRIPDDNEWKNQTINSINDDMDLLISYINGDMDRCYI